MTTGSEALTIWTLGHSTRSLEQLARLASAHGVTTIADVRTVPRSRRNPQFNRETLPADLSAHDLRYVHLPGLGGLRHPRPDSPNAGWRNASFRGYADHMQTAEFAENLDALVDLAARECVAVMCAEAVPWRCHRSLLADALTARGIRVEHIMTETRSQAHTMHAWARLAGTRIIYPPEAPTLPGVVSEVRTARPSRRRAPSARSTRHR
jgi:uncharacterized protein (DUF488 family)